jgi:leucyl-tRNA synthetase
LERVYTIVIETIGNLAEPVEDEQTRHLRRVTHKTIKVVTEDFETFSLNTAIARLMELVNELMKLKDTATANTRAWHEATRTLTLLLAPAAPHIAEELWARMGNPFSVHQQAWPEWDPELAADEEIEIAVSVNGKVRGRLQIAPDAAESDVLAAAKADQRVAAYLTGPLVKEIYVPGRLVNFVVR